MRPIVVLVPAVAVVVVVAWHRRRRRLLPAESKPSAEKGGRSSTRAAASREQGLVDLLTSYVGCDHAKALLEAMRRPPMLMTIRVNTAVATRDAALQQLTLLRASEPEIGLCQALDELEPHPVLPDVLQLRVHGPQPLKVLPRVLVVDRGCGEACLRGADVFGPGVLACSPSLRPGEDVSVLFADPLRRDEPPLGARLPEGATAAAEQLERDGWVHVGNGVAKHGRHELFPSGGAGRGCDHRELLRAVGLVVQLQRRRYPTPSLQGVLPSLLFLQNLPSAATVHALAPQPGERILDMCAAPGGKATHCAARLAGRGRVVALDRSARRLDAVRALAARLRVDATVECMRMDATAAHERLPRRSFDRVLLDPPCSSLGVRPRFVVGASVAELGSCAAYQRRLLAAAAALLRPGGVLTYSTCTTNPQENEELVAHALAAHAHLRLEPLPAPLAAGALGAGPGWPGCGLDNEQRRRVLRWDPARPGGEGHIGFFLARFRADESAGSPHLE